MTGSIKAPLVNAYGEEKSGKTSAALAAFPGALVVGAPDNIRLIWRNSLDLNPDWLWLQDPVVRDLEGLRDLILSFEGDPDPPPAIIVDDMGKLVQSTYARFEASPQAITKKGSFDNFYAGKMTGPLIAQCNEAARHLGIAIIVILHEKAGKFNDAGAWVRGRCALPWGAMSSELMQWFDINVRVTTDPDSLIPWYNRSFFHEPGNRAWVTGDRSEVCWDKTPGSLYEVLRAGGCDVRRFHGKALSLLWQDDVAAEVCALMKKSDPRHLDEVQEVLRLESKRWTGSGRAQKHLRWAIQDGVARFVIERHRDADIFDFGPSKAQPVNKAAGGPSPASLPPTTQAGNNTK